MCGNNLHTLTSLICRHADASHTIKFSEPFLSGTGTVLLALSSAFLVFFVSAASEGVIGTVPGTELEFVVIAPD